MATHGDLKDALHDTLVGVMETRSDVSDGTDHVVLANAGYPEQPPGVGFQVPERPDDRGIGGDPQVDALLTNPSGDVNDIRYREDRIAEVEITPMARTDETLADVYQQLRQHFLAYGKALDESSLHDDVQGVTVQSMSPQSRDDGRMSQFTVEIEYGYTFLHSDVIGETLPPAAAADIEVGDSDPVTGTVDSG